MHSKESEPVLMGGKWRPADEVDTFSVVNPRTKETLDRIYPVSSMKDVETALMAAREVSRELVLLPPETIADFLECYADLIEKKREILVDAAFEETALAKRPRLNDVEIPRTTDQLRQAARAARARSWKLPVIDTKLNIRSYYAPLGGAVVIFGPSNFPFAFNGISGGDFAAAVAAGNPVVVKAHPFHPETTRLLAEEALKALQETKLPLSTVQLLYGTKYEDGEKMVSHPLVGAVAYTGSKRAGLRLKAAADRAGKPIYLELGSLNPVVILPGSLKERASGIFIEFITAFLAGTGQFCTNPGFVIMIRGRETDGFLLKVKERLETEPVGTLLGEGVEKSLVSSVEALQAAGAEVLTGGSPGGGEGYCYHNTLLKIDGESFLKNPQAFQMEAFGNAGLFVVAENGDEICRILESFEGNLVGCIYSHTKGEDDELYDKIAPVLRLKVGRLTNEKMPPGVALSPAMNHGGPYPATGHPGFTAVGIPASMLRFAMLQCFDNVREDKLPLELRDKNPTGEVWRNIDGRWTQDDIIRKGLS
jgi:alpha-ketoglutaric semialdehyde dehydrogenase